MSQLNFIINSFSDFIPIINLLKSNQYPHVITLNGDLGAGKTTFVRNFVQSLDPNIIVSSPTFTLLNIYSSHNTSIHHFDLYRLNSSDEALELGFDEFITNCDFAFVEWAERAPEIIPAHHTIINLQHGEHENQRILTLSQSIP